MITRERSWPMLAVLVLMLTAAGGWAQLPMKKFSYHEGFEERDPVVPWVSNGKFKVNFKGLTDEQAFEGQKCFKLDVTLLSGSYHYWSAPVKVACGGKLKFSARLMLGEGTNTRAQVGLNFQFPPTSHSGCSSREGPDKPTGEWKLVEFDVTNVGLADAEGVISRYTATARADEVGVYVDRWGIFIYGGQGKRAVVYVDDVRIEGEAPEEAAYQADIKRRWAKGQERLQARIRGWREQLRKAEDALGKVAALPAAAQPALEAAQESAAEAKKLIEQLAKRGYGSATELTQLEGYLELLAYAPGSLAALAQGAKTAQPYIVYVPRAISNQRIRTNEFPVPARIGDEVRLSACRGEYESASLALYALTDVKSLLVSATDLRGPGTIPREAVDISVVKCWWQAGFGIGDRTHTTLAPELLLKDDRLVRVDLEKRENYVRSTAKDGTETYLLASGKTSENLKELRPVDAETLQPFDLPAKQVKQVWLTVHVPEDAKPGEYEGRLNLTTSGKTKEIPLRVTVHPFELEPTPLTYSIYYRGKLAAEGSISSEAKSEEQYLAEMRDLASHGVLYPTIYQGYSEDLLPRALELRRQAGLPAGKMFTLGISSGAPTTAEALARLKQGVQSWIAMGKRFGYEEVHVYGIDEARGERLKAQRAAWQAVHEAGAKMFVACYKGTFEAMGDLLDVAVLAGRPNPEEAKKYHGIGHQAFCYAYPQVGNEEPETYRRNFGLVLWQAGFDGAMDYAYQHSFGHIWNDFDHNHYRDHNFTYPTVNGIVDTVQWEGFREAVDDTRYVATLLKAIKEAPKEKAAAAKEAQAWLDGLDPSGDLYEIRAQMVEWIKRLK